jgi:hypothetical protein
VRSFCELCVSMRRSLSWSDREPLVLASSRLTQEPPSSEGRRLREGCRDERIFSTYFVHSLVIESDQSEISVGLIPRKICSQLVSQSEKKRRLTEMSTDDGVCKIGATKVLFEIVEESSRNPTSRRTVVLTRSTADELGDGR